MRPRTLRAGFPCILLHTIHGDATSDGDGAGGDENIEVEHAGLSEPGSSVPSDGGEDVPQEGQKIV